MKRIDVILQKVLFYARKASEFTQDIGETEFYANTEKQYAVGLALLQIGEMVSLLPEDFRMSHPDLPWRKIKGLRNIIAHHYSTVDENLLWKLLSDDLPALIKALELITPEER